jgi:hypothetical protein
MEEDRRELEKKSLRNHFEATLEDQADRAMRVKLHRIIPNEYFSAVSAECVHDFVSGRFYSCVTLSQSVAEGLAKFLASKNNINVLDDHKALINQLQQKCVISAHAYAAFRRIRGKPKEDRNDYHHLDQNVEQRYHALEARAEECLSALFEIESEVFAFQFDEGRIIPRNTLYWRKGSKPNALQVYVRSV